MYHILDRNDGHDDGHDKGGSKAYPSRTAWGAGYSLEEKHPHLFTYRWFTKAWGYWDGYTKAQIKLMSLDIPVVNYSEKSGPTLTKNEADAMYEAWKRERGGETYAGKKIDNLNDIFK